ncbi:hypothetical protein D3C81_144450 [compost metagenome]
MSNAYYRLYEDSVLAMAKTIVIKSEASANAINTGLSEVRPVPFDVDVDDPATWKYYLNLAGRYHPFDTKMTVMSIETRQEIPFDIETLAVHTDTRRAYAFGTRYYNELVKRFPAQEDLILGILNPVDLQTAIDAPDGQILWIDQSLIEENETNLVAQIQEKINARRTRWDVADYVNVDDLYPAGQLLLQALELPVDIMNARLANCKTDQVHSFHIRSYLASHGRLDQFMSHMNKEQMLFFYRNILWIQRNAGKQETFDWLVDRVMTLRKLPVAEFNLHHNVSDQPDNLYPTIEVKRKDLTRMASGNPVDTWTVEGIVNREATIAPGNYNETDREIRRVVDLMKNSPKNRLKTKVLESSVVDRSNDYALTFSDVLLNHWVYFAQEGLYNTIIAFDNPLTGDQLWFNAKDAFILFIYALNKALGQDLPYVPNIDACMVRKRKLPTKADLRKITEADRVSDRLLDALLADQPVLDEVISVDAFYNKCVQIHAAWREHNWLYTTQEHHVSRGQAEAAANHLYMNKECNLANKVSYDTWLKDHQIDTTDFSKAEYELLYTNLLALATGTSLKVTVSLDELQKAMIRLLTQLSSYTVQFIRELRGTNMIALNWSAIRQGDTAGKGEGGMYLHSSNVYVQNVDGKGHHVDSTTLDEVTFTATNSAFEGHADGYDPTINFGADAYTRYHARMVIPTVYLSVPEVKVLELDDVINQSPIPEYLYLPNPPHNIGEYKNINTVLTQVNLDGFDYRPNSHLPLPTLTINGFEYSPSEEIPLALQNLGGFDYAPSPVPPLNTQQNLTGFDYEELGVELELTKDQTGFDYREPENPLATEPDLTGFDYGVDDTPDLQLISEMPGFDYPTNAKRLNLNPVMDGFEYPEPPKKLNLAQMSGFDYTPFEEERIALAATMDGLEYGEQPEALALASDMDGFKYSNKLADMVVITRLPGLGLTRP